jgi:hypothetical protein
MRFKYLILWLFMSLDLASASQFRPATIPGEPYTDLIFDKHMPVYDKLICHKLYGTLEKETTIIIQNKAYLPFGVNGVTYDLGNSTYLIQLVHQETDEERWWTLLHEWAHVFQFVQGKLEEPVNGPIKWMGVPNDFSKPWAERPWEIGAEEMANQLWNEYLPFTNKPDGRPREK